MPRPRSFCCYFASAFGIYTSVSIMIDPFVIASPQNHKPNLLPTHPVDQNTGKASVPFVVSPLSSFLRPTDRLYPTIFYLSHLPSHGGLVAAFILAMHPI